MGRAAENSSAGAHTSAADLLQDKKDRKLLHRAHFQAPPLATPGEDDIQQHRPYLLRYALLQLRNPDQAEDVVQETLLAALEGRARFAGGSTLKTWLTGILKHKILDAIRRKSREQPLAPAGDDDTETVDTLFKNDGHWQQMPATWGDPAQALENRKFWEIFELCSRLMPERTARVYMLREVMELSTEEICQEFSITPTNLWVILHRARLALRECLEIKWFGAAQK
jgi:RNA polymerase sigma-70 factor, ECF subfamily